MGLPQHVEAHVLGQRVAIHRLDTDMVTNSPDTVLVFRPSPDGMSSGRKPARLFVVDQERLTVGRAAVPVLIVMAALSAGTALTVWNAPEVMIGGEIVAVRLPACRPSLRWQER